MEDGVLGSGVYITTTFGEQEFKIRNPDNCSVFRSELIAIRRGLQYAVQVKDHSRDIWILTDSRSSIQHLSNWSTVGDQTSLDILKLLESLSPDHTVHFQWIPSHVGVEGNEKADFLARSGSEEGVNPGGELTFSEISSLAKIKINKLTKIPPNHSWYFAKRPGETFNIRPRQYQTAFSRYLSGHTRGITFQQGQKKFPDCPWCYINMASPEHILTCLNFKRDEVLLDPTKFLDILYIFGFMGVV